MASQGSRVLAVELNPQGNLSVALGGDLQELESTRCASHSMMLDARGEASAYHMRARPGLDLIPSCLDHDANKQFIDSNSSCWYCARNFGSKGIAKSSSQLIVNSHAGVTISTPRSFSISRLQLIWMAISRLTITTLSL
jgi:hypothetical protein